MLVHSPVNAKDGRNAKALLVAVQRKALRTEVDFLTAISVQACRRDGIVVCYRGFYVLHISVVITVCIHTTESQIESEVVQRLVRGAKLQTEEILATLHVGIHAIACQVGIVF